jgi:alpha-L-fucosidase
MGGKDGGASRTRWFEEARLGMFIHWGLFAQTRGRWNGNNYYGIVEYLQQVFRVPCAEYARLADAFDPQAFDAREWIRTAREAGFRYIVITAKHHEGFALFKSAVDAFNVADATPFGRDVIAELAEAAHAEGMPLGFYYSQFLDWRDPDAPGNDWDFPVAGRNIEAYMDRKARPQLRELLTNYGPVAILWFDIPGESTLEQSRSWVDLVAECQPQTLVSSRVGNGLGDFENFGDNEVPGHRARDIPWEAIFTHNECWGFSEHDHSFKSARTLIRKVAKVASRGGNTMINVGPEPGGQFPEPTRLAFAELGEWLRTNGESIYATAASPVGPVPWGVITCRPGLLYLHVLDAPADGRLIGPGASALGPGSARLLAGGILASATGGEDLWIELPLPLPDPRDTVIALEVENLGAGPIAPVHIASRAHEAIEIDTSTARLGGGVRHRRIAGWSYFGRTNWFSTLEGMRTPADSVEWDVRFLDPGTYWLEIEYAADRDQAGREAVIAFAERDYPFRVLETGKIDHHMVTPFTRQPLGQVVVREPGVHTLVMRAKETVLGGYQLDQRPVHANSELFVFRRLILKAHD